MKKRSKALIIILILVVFCVSIIGVLAKLSFGFMKDNQISQTQNVVEKQDVLNDISKRTGLEPNWMAIRTYIYCDLLKPGAPRSVVDNGLSQIGEYYNTGLGLTQEISFKNRFIKVNLSPIVIYYDKNNIVVDSGAGEENYGDRSECELEKAKTLSVTSTP